MSRTVLLVTGSRALAEAPFATIGDAKSVLARELMSLHPGDFVVAGDAPGPDAWAINGASARDLNWVRYHRDGRWTTDDSLRPSGRWDGEGKLSAAERLMMQDPWRAPLVRNAAMIRALRRPLELGYRVRGVGLVAEWSKTRGTDHTLRLAAADGITCERVPFALEAT